MTEIQAAFTLDIPIVKPNISAINWLANHCDLSKQRLKDAMSKGAVWLKLNESNNKHVKPIRRSSKVLPVGATLYLYYDGKVLTEEPKIPTLLCGEDTYSVWYKPHGMLSHGSKWGDHCSIIRWVEQHHQPQRPCFLIHRLDRAASGIIAIGHNKKSTAAICQLFEKRQIEKRYQAIVSGRFPEGETEVNTPIDNKPARTIINVSEYHQLKDQSLVDITIETGRKHQIRRHLSSLGHPIIGDRQYNNASITETSPDLQLRAYYLRFICPITQKNQSVTLNKDLLLRFKNP